MCKCVDKRKPICYNRGIKRKQKGKATMTTILKQTRTNTHYIALTQEGNTLKVSASPIFNSGDLEYVGYSERETIYHYSELKKAQATFTRYTKKYL